jgi:hypothetical protein
MVRDGASLHSFLQHARGAKYSVLKIGICDGEVFGAFTNEPWRNSWNNVGGAGSLLWRMDCSLDTGRQSQISDWRTAGGGPLVHFSDTLVDVEGLRNGCSKPVGGERFSLKR